MECLNKNKLVLKLIANTVQIKSNISFSFGGLNPVNLTSTLTSNLHCKAPDEGQSSLLDHSAAVMSSLM